VRYKHINKELEGCSGNHQLAAVYCSHLEAMIQLMNNFLQALATATEQPVQ
jgi:hypothetical protein